VNGTELSSYNNNLCVPVGFRRLASCTIHLCRRVPDPEEERTLGGSRSCKAEILGVLISQCMNDFILTGQLSCLHIRQWCDVLLYQEPFQHRPWF
jgi:hypothetical protein